MKTHPPLAKAVPQRHELRWAHPVGRRGFWAAVVGEEEDEEADGAEAEAVVRVGERPLQLPLVHATAPVAVRRPERALHLRVRPRREHHGRGASES